MRAVAAAIALVVGLPASVAAREDPEVQVAREHFRKGQAQAEAEHWAEALEELEAARAIKALPELDYNIGLCNERLDRPTDAIAAFQRFINGSVDERAIAETREHIDRLRRAWRKISRRRRHRR